MAYVGRTTRSRARSLRRRLTNAEAILWYRLRGLPAFRFRRQHPVGPFIADFACVHARLVVEIDGATHSTDEERAYDARREAYLKERGWSVLRIPNIDVYERSDDVVDGICEAARLRLLERAQPGD